MRYGRVVLVALAALCIVRAAPAYDPVPESASVSYFALELDGAFVGYIDAVQLATSDTGLLVDKRGLSKDIANLHATEITFQADAAMGKPMYDWIKSSMNMGSSGRKSGAIIYADFNYKALSRLEFQNALITEVGFPALDAASKDAAKMTVTIRPESSSRTFARTKDPLTARKQKAWLCSNFRVDLGRLQFSPDASACSQPPLINPTYGPPAMEVASVIFNPREYQLFLDWQNILYCSGAPQESNESPCTFTYQDPDGATLFTTSFISTGLFKLTPNTDATGAVVSYTALLYVTGGASFDSSVPTH